MKALDRLVVRARGEARAKRLLDAARPLDGMPSSAHDRVKARLHCETAATSPRVRPWLKPVVVGAALLICGTASGIAIDRLVLNRQKDPHIDSPTQNARAAIKGRPSKTIAPVVDVRPDPPVVMAETPAEPAASVLPTQIPSTDPTRAPRKLAMRDINQRLAPPTPSDVAPTSGSAERLSNLAPPSTPLPAPVPAPVTETQPAVAPVPVPDPAPAPTTISEERLLADAVRALRTEKNGQAALERLDLYRDRYPHGRFAVEADILRVDALTALHQREDALRTLDQLDLAGIPNAVERRLQRGELRKQAGRWQDAHADFDWALARAPAQDQSALDRALWGQVECLQHEGSPDRARAAAASYLARFPHGRFADRADLLVHPTTP